MSSSDASRISTEKDPCSSESALSMKCLELNNYDKTKCELAFENYRHCKSFWSKVSRARRKEGLLPLLPPVEERAEMKQYFKQTGKIPTTPQG